MHLGYILFAVIFLIAGAAYYKHRAQIKAAAMLEEGKALSCLGAVETKVKSDVSAEAKKL